ncbi:Alpha/Beta hydrolase protein [Abortiporus biennis]|nr:Alpha/Beta hydrolase protein [Abortiporus biennis]
MPKLEPYLEGDLDFTVPSAGKPCKTHYWVFGDPKSSKPGVRPLIGLHGGPGFTHDYISNISHLTQLFGIPVVLYDQLGGGKSTHLAEKNGDTSFWAIGLFIEELENLLKGLGIEEFDLFGHSWGSIVISSFAIRKPKGLKKIVLASGLASMNDWIESGKELKKLLSEEAQDILKKHEEAGTTDSEEYQGATMEFYKRFACRLGPWPEDLLSSFGSMMQDPTVYHTINGPNEFLVIGPLKDHDITSELHKIEATTLITNGKYDEAQDKVVLPFFLNIPKVKWVQFAESSHVAFLEEEDRYLKVLGEFLLDI